MKRGLFLIGLILLVLVPVVQARDLSVANCLDTTAITQVNVRHWEYPEWGPPYTWDEWILDPAQVAAMVDTTYPDGGHVTGVKDQRWILYDQYVNELGRVVVWRYPANFGLDYDYILNVKDTGCMLVSDGTPAGYP